jgi:RNA polymerase sigma-70 factor (ECF subfamily)
MNRKPFPHLFILLGWNQSGLTMDDQSLWNRIVDGDVDALRMLHEKYYNPMWLWAGKFTRNEVMAEEMVSDCFIKLWDNRRKIIIEKSLKSYLFLMLRNQIISQSRKSKHEFVFDFGNIPDVPDETEINNQDFYVELYAAISKIPEQRRKILELAAFESLSYKEIAERLSISVNTVKTQMGRAYQFLKEELDPKNFLLFHFFMKMKK